MPGRYSPALQHGQTTAAASCHLSPVYEGVQRYSKLILLQTSIPLLTVTQLSRNLVTLTANPQVLCGFVQLLCLSIVAHFEFGELYNRNCAVREVHHLMFILLGLLGTDK